MTIINLNSLSMRKVALLQFITLTLLSFMLGCTSISNKQSTSEKHNFKYGLSYKLNVDDNTAEILFLNKNDAPINALTLPNKTVYIAKEQLREFCRSDGILCAREKSESNFVSWSPDGEFLAVFAGDTQGFWFLPTIEITKSAFNESHILKVGLHQTTNQFNIGLFHQTGGWLNNEQYIFSAGLSGNNFIYKFNTKTKELKGFPFELNEDSTVSNFEEVFVDSYSSQKSSFKISDVTKQLKILK
ncbi:hypothetical protein D172_002940 [Pseudoalteromonas sp. Bsw20308]|uniref:hypothetical protein n=1 Tax=Pseudoalteromonas sp. Bsw20308 TaxID=283699 RepID=UPI0002AA6D36|nr:hypothetical protein [Pseudoalteromonas sp. Bsw20308]ALQ07110.1 hypothetical protein D172_002940 [Pseudoalteromonas sp. Bsw20308]